MLETLRRIAIKQGSVKMMIPKLANTLYNVGKDRKHRYQTDGLQYQYLALDEELKSLTLKQGISTYFTTIHENRALIFVNGDVPCIRDVKYPDAGNTPTVKKMLLKEMASPMTLEYLTMV